jgi:plastocyanin
MRRKVAVFAAAFTLALALGMSTAVAGGGCHPPASTTEGTGLMVSIKNCSYSPSILHVPTGGTITWVNDDYLPHAVNGTGFDATDPYTSINPGSRTSHQFNIAGIYPYMCYVHPGMAGIVVVGDVAFPGAPPAPITPLRQPAPLASAAAVVTAPAPSVASTSTSAPVELPIALALVLGAALGSIATARWPRRWRVALPSWSA